MTEFTNQPSREPHTPPLVASVRFQPRGKLYHFDASAHPDLHPGDFVLVKTTRGEQLGEVVSVLPPDENLARQNLKPIQRLATGRDLAIRQQWNQKGIEALAVARQIAAQLRLPVKLATAEYTFDGQILTLLYVTEEKNCNFNELLKRLKHKVPGHIEMRHIGVRDHAKLLDGYGACGEPRCCSRHLTNFAPVSIRMAKTQGLSLNPAEITGMCGRLRCCLTYEQEQYAEASKLMPRRKKRVRTPHGDGKVVNLLPLKGIVVVQLEDRRVEVPLEDIEVITS